MKPKLLDLFCGAGGAAMGYHRAGFDVTGVDIKPQPRYPFTFIQGDALEYVAAHGQEYDVIHASPPCQAFSIVTPKAYKKNHKELISKTRRVLRKVGKPYIIENVPGAKRRLNSGVLLCGTMFNLRCWRHRLFEIEPHVLLLTRPCDHSTRPLLVTTAGNNSRAIREPGEYKSVKNAPAAYGIDWMIAAELAESIPPAYTEFIGSQIKAHLSLE